MIKRCLICDAILIINPQEQYNDQHYLCSEVCCIKYISVTKWHTILKKFIVDLNDLNKIRMNYKKKPLTRLEIEMRHD